MTDYSKMSDLEINIMVSKSLYGELSNWHKGELNEGVTDYCNNPSDAWPIIYGELISLSATETSEGNHRWFAFSREREGYKQVACGNPLRAAMIVYLMMKESENG